MPATETAMARARTLADELRARKFPRTARKAKINAMGTWILETSPEISDLAWTMGREGKQFLEDYLALWRELATDIKLPSIRKPIPKLLRLKIIARDHQTCTYCGKPGNATHGPDGGYWHIDHIVPVAACGDDDENNLTLACASCNLRKSAQLDWVYTP